VGYGGVEIKYLSTKIFLMFYALIAPIVLAFTFDALIHMRARMCRLQYATAVLQDKIALSEVVVDLSAAQRHREEQLRQQQALPRRNDAHTKPAGTEQQTPPRGEELVEVDLEGGTPLHFPPRANSGVQKVTTAQCIVAAWWTQQPHRCANVPYTPSIDGHANDGRPGRVVLTTLAAGACRSVSAATVAPTLR
jgi:hypothetical protein